ncbi:MAG: VPLPA-CTERM sorting domain-containing protein [Gammaproteobacteria bacterium]|nr:VPLPA-CTERM sorting domain-containing protein [Gammaproteobacteria bacterium]MDH5736296.1 VPLPA-CTERM sorting domain-containing protein [Gammaproteobacteria bacterium]
MNIISKSGLALFAGLTATTTTQAASVSFDLTLSGDDLTHISGSGVVTGNIPNGNTYATVTIDDEGAAGLINFNVSLSDYWTGKQDTGFGIDSFGFNVLDPEERVGLVATDITGLSSNWLADVDYTPPNNAGTTQNGFGKFDAVIDTNSAGSRLTSLAFSIDNQFYAFDTISDYIAGSNPGDNGSYFFAAHIAGFTDQNPLDPVDTCIGVTLDANNPDCNLLTSTWVGTNTTVVPVPAALWLFGSGLIGLAGIARRKTKE